MDQLIEGIRRLGLPEREEAVDGVRAFLAELAIWNRRRDLVQADPAQLIVKHVLDSLAGVPVIRALPHDTIADVGSGAGFPGIPLALFLPESRFTLIERSAKRAAFLRAAITLLDLRARVEVVELSLDRVVGSFSIVALRAFRELTAFAGQLFAITAPKGCVVAYKGKRAVVERELRLIHDQIDRATVESVSVPGMTEERTIAVIYPRSMLSD